MEGTAFLSVRHSFRFLTLQRLAPRVRSSSGFLLSPQSATRKASNATTVNATTSLNMHGPAGPFPRARDRRTLQRRAARAHRGAQAQARPLAPGQLLPKPQRWPPRPRRGERAAGPRARPALARGRLTYLRPPQARGRRARGNGASAANTPGLSIREGMFTRNSRETTALQGQEQRPGVPRAPARPRPACALLGSRHRRREEGQGSRDI